MNPNELRLLFDLAKSKGCKFIALTYRSSESGELARHNLLFGSDYKSALEHDLKYLERLRKHLGSKKYTNAAGATNSDMVILFTACDELVNSTKKALEKYDGDQLTKEAKEKDVYNTIFPGVKQHKETGTYYLWALAHGKKVIEPGTKSVKTVNSKPLTVAKDRIRRKLRTNKYRNFRLDSIAKATVNGDTINIE